MVTEEELLRQSRKNLHRDHQQWFCDCPEDEGNTWDHCFICGAMQCRVCGGEVA